jgi:GNAT superfamily N-acetyltransferase
MKIRRAREEDVPQLEQLFLTSRQQTFYWEDPTKFKLEDYRKQTVGEEVFVAEEGQIIGFISVWAEDRPAFIHHLFVSSEYQRRGVGTRLIHSLASWLSPPYRLKCLVQNLGARIFYKKMGWIELEVGVSPEGDYLLLELEA